MVSAHLSSPTSRRQTGQTGRSPCRFIRRGQSVRFVWCVTGVALAEATSALPSSSGADIIDDLMNMICRAEPGTVMRIERVRKMDGRQGSSLQRGNEGKAEPVDWRRERERERSRRSPAPVYRQTGRDSQLSIGEVVQISKTASSLTAHWMVVQCEWLEQNQEASFSLGCHFMLPSLRNGAS